VLVDLAGSERLKETGNTGAVALRETGSINRSLFTLGQVRSSQLHCYAPLSRPLPRKGCRFPSARGGHGVGSLVC